MKQSWRKVVREVVDGKGWADEEGEQQQRDKMGKVTEARGKARRVILKVCRRPSSWLLLSLSP
jgi:hypothetical protein